MKLLEDIKVLDATQVWAGPLASMHLGDLGAEVIKVERPGTGDRVRHVPPFVDGMSGYFATVNRNKDSITLNLATEQGREIFLELAKEADGNCREVGYRLRLGPCGESRDHLLLN